jgi:hypothetical protein
MKNLAQQLTEERKEDEDEDRGTTEMQTKDLTDILSVIHMVADKLCDIDRLGTQLYSKEGHNSHATHLL